MKAFPAIFEITDTSYIQQGMDLRDWFAGLAMQSMNSRPDYEDVPASVIALDSYTLADEMMKAREK